MIPAETIVDVKARHELAAFIESSGTALKRAGKGYLGLCPFHEDRRPSLSVDPVKQSWCCLGACSTPGKVAGGDVIEFARRLWGLSFPEALRRLGGTTTMTLDRKPRSHPSLRVVGRPGAPRPLNAAELLAQVTALYHQGFVSSAEARDYASSRGITSAELLSALPMGFSDGSLLERAPEGSQTREALKALGLFTESGRELLAGCLVVPLRDLDGRVVGFYGRKIEGDGHLYLPGPRRGLVNAPCAATAEEIILAESVLDALSFLQAGIPNAIPLYGTNGFTPDHEALLEKHRIRRVILALDADEAGQKAAMALAEKLLSRGIEARNVLLPVKDPNQLLVAEGAEGFRETWKRLISARAPESSEKEEPGNGSDGRDAHGSERFSSFAASQNAPLAEAPHEAAAALALDDTGAYVLALGERAWRVRGLSTFGVDRLRVNLRVDQGGRFHVDTFDLYSARSRSAFVESALKALHLQEGDAGTLADELATVIEALEKERLSLRARGETKVDPKAMTSVEEAEAMEMLKGDLVGALARDLQAVGLVGEETALSIGYFALVSRKLDEPLSVLFCARSGAGKSVLQDRLCDFCPPEDLVKYTRISGQVLFYKEEDALKHKLLAVDEEDGASNAAYALRNLLSSGCLSCSVTRTDPQTGRQTADDRRVNGPTAVFMTTAHPEAFDYETRNRYVLVTVDESKEQTKRILQLQRWNETVEGLLARERRKAIFRRHHNAQRLLRPLEVVIPVELAYPSGHLILRREQKKYLSLIKAIALLHQHQRPRKTLAVEGRAVEYVEATEEDVGIARGLARAILSRNLDELAPPSRSLYAAMGELVREKKKARPAAKKEKTQAEPGSPRRYALRREGEEEESRLLDRREIQRATGLSLWHVKAYMPQLIEYEYVAQVTGRKGARCLYELIDEEDETGCVAKAPHLADLAEPGAPGLSEASEAEPAS